MFTYDKDKEFRQITKSFLYPVLLYLRQMSLNLMDTGGIAGVRAHKFGGRTGFAGRHFLPEIDGDFGVITSHCHKDQPHIISLRFVFAGEWQHNTILSTQTVNRVTDLLDGSRFIA